jgi:peptidoglycan-associated lipoprotein
MKKLILFVTAVVFLFCGCKKGKQDVANAGDADAVASRGNSDNGLDNAPKPEDTQVATGDLKDLLLALRRVHFSFDAAILTDSGKKALDEAAEKLQALPKVELYVDGHTDDRGTTEYNMSLGERRAQTVVSYLKNLGIEPERLNIVSFGEESPLASGSSEVAQAKNRRVDFRIMRGDIEFVLEEGELVDDEGKPLEEVSQAR